MKWLLIPILILLNCLVAMGQKTSSFNLVVAGGASYFFNDPSLHRRIDNTKSIGVNYLVTNKSRVFSFNPAINFQINDYHSSIAEFHVAQVNQGLFSLNLDVLMKISKSSLLRVGLLFSKVAYSSISQTYRSGTGYYTIGNSELERGFMGTSFQTGFTLGVSFPFRLFKRDHKFNIRFVQIVSPLVSRDYNLTAAQVGADTKILSLKARPSMLILGFDFNFKKLKKRKTEEERD